MTGGAKFGGDWLAYPGDPFVYHAQFVVRVVEMDETIKPLFFASAAREAHSARKHLLYAFSEKVLNPTVFFSNTFPRWTTIKKSLWNISQSHPLKNLVMPIQTEFKTQIDDGRTVG